MYARLHFGAEDGHGAGGVAFVASDRSGDSASPALVVSAGIDGELPFAGCCLA